MVVPMALAVNNWMGFWVIKYHQIHYNVRTVESTLSVYIYVK